MEVEEKKSILTPQQSKFLEYYLSPSSDSFSNALQSAIKAGYSEEYANNIMAPSQNNKGWLLENIGRGKMLQKAERNLDRYLDSPDDEIGFKATSLVAKTLGKAIYSERTEVTGADGAPIVAFNYAPPKVQEFTDISPVDLPANGASDPEFSPEVPNQ